MGSPTSRRAFLFGRRAPPSEWGKFCARLARTCSGQVRWEERPGQPQAWLVPARERDIVHAHALCREYRVKMALDGIPIADPSAGDETPRLWVESGSAWAQLTPSDAAGLVWCAGGGTKLRSLQEAGVQVLSGADPEQTVAQWLASRASAQWPTGQGMLSGIEQVQVMLADGTIAVLGPFGANATTPLRSLTVQKMIPRLFELASSAFAIECAQAERWPVRFRLDALMPGDGMDINLARLFAGHGASLGWVQAVWFRRDVPFQAPVRPEPMDMEASRREQYDALARQLKESFDPIGIFP